MNPRIDIDFAPSGAGLRSRLTQWLILATVGLGAGVGYDAVEVFAREADLAGQLAARQTPRPPRAKLGPAVPPEQIEAANRVVDAIDWPWDALLGAVERAAVDSATLLSVEPDPERRELRLQGEAKDSLAMLAYVRALAGQAPLSNVYLAGHQISLQGNQRAIRFTAQASWRDDLRQAGASDAAAASTEAAGAASGLARQAERP